MLIKVSCGHYGDRQNYVTEANQQLSDIVNHKQLTHDPTLHNRMVN